MLLDKKISQAVYRAKLLERAYHDSGPWFIQFNQGSMRACHREITDTEIIFRVMAPVQYDTVTLMCRDESLSSCSVNGEIGGVVEWVLSPTEITSTAVQ